MARTLWIPVVTASLLLGAASGAEPSADELLQRDDQIAELMRKVDVLTDEVATLRTQVAVPEETQMKSAYGFGPAASKVYGIERGLSIGGYGEANYTNFIGDEEDSDLDRSDALLQRGQALQAKVATGEVQMPEREKVDERWEGRRRWRRETPGPVVIERPRLVRDDDLGPAPSSASSSSAGSTGMGPSTSPGLGLGSMSGSSAAQASSASRAAALRPSTIRETEGWLEHAPTPERPSDPVGAALWDALERGSRRAAVAALHELLDRKERDEDLLPVWNEIATLGIPQGLRLGDLIDACALSKQSAF
jgi:hypothetical protein